MVHTQNGKWSGTWVPRNGNAGSPARIELTALLAVQNSQFLANQIYLTATLTSGAGAPLSQSVLNAASFAAVK
jgi:hypothetical protein